MAKTTSDRLIIDIDDIQIGNTAAADRLDGNTDVVGNMAVTDSLQITLQLAT